MYRHRLYAYIPGLDTSRNKIVKKVMNTADIFRTSRHIVRFSFHFNIINSISSLALKVSVLRVHTVMCIYMYLSHSRFIFLTCNHQ